jgi:hypothetical protein
VRGTTCWAIGPVSIAPVVVALAVALSPAAHAAKDGAEPPARFTMNPAEGGGFVRLDTVTGQMSLCTRKDAQWLCTDMADQGRGLAEEVERLRSENKELKAEIRRMEDIMLGDGKGGGKQADREPSPDSRRRAEGPAGKYGLPSEQDIDQAIGYMERLYRKFRDKMKDFESDSKGTPL